MMVVGGWREEGIIAALREALDESVFVLDGAALLPHLLFGPGRRVQCQ